MQITGSMLPDSVALDLGTERRAPRRASSACRRSRGSPRSSVSPSPIAAISAARWEIDLSARRPQRCRAAGPTGSKRVLIGLGAVPTTVTLWPSSRTSAAARSACSSPATQSEIAPERHVGRRMQRHVLDVDPGLAERQRELGDRPGPVGDDDAQLAQRRRRRVRPRAGGGDRSPAPRVPGGDRVAHRPRGSAPRPRRRRSATPSIASATASRLLAKMSPQIAGLAPATRVVSRKLGPTSGSRSESRVSSAAAWPTSTLATTCGRWLTVAISRSWASASIACGAGAEAGDDALQAVVEHAAGALGRRQVPAGALEEVGAGVLDPGGLGAGQRVAADEALVARRARRRARAWSSRRR